jgi:hypothetical protein
MKVLRYYFEYGVDTALWPEDLDSPFGYPCDPQRLPVPQHTRDEITRLACWYQSSMNQDYPPDPGPWGEVERTCFNTAARALLAALRRELPDSCRVEDRYVPL